MARPFGIDVNRYSGMVDGSLIVTHAPRVEFASVRRSISWGYQDSYFPHNIQQFRNHGIPVTAYHVIYPKQDALRQMDNFYMGIPDGVRKVLDIELRGDGKDDLDFASPERISATVWACTQICYQRDGLYPIAYSRAEFVNSQLYPLSAAQQNLYYWWLAHYANNRATEHPGPPAVPKRVTVDRVIIHQTADKTPPIPGTSGNALDYNRWIGQMPVASFFGSGGGGGGAAGNLTVEQRLSRLENVVFGGT